MKLPPPPPPPAVTVASSSQNALEETLAVTKKDLDFQRAQLEELQSKTAQEVTRNRSFDDVMMTNRKT
jgi:hypothetical protein